MLFRCHKGVLTTSRQRASVLRPWGLSVALCGDKYRPRPSIRRGKAALADFHDQGEV